MVLLNFWYVLVSGISHNSSYYLKLLYVTEVPQFICQLHCNQVFNLDFSMKVFCHL